MDDRGVTRSQPSAWVVACMSQRPKFAFVRYLLSQPGGSSTTQRATIQGPSVNAIVHSLSTVPIVLLMSWSTTSGVGFPGRADGGVIAGNGQLIRRPNIGQVLGVR